MSNGANPAYNSASGMNPLVWAANPLLDMIAHIRAMHSLEHAAPLRTRLVAEIGHFERRAQSAGVSRDELIGARYCLCTVLDEVAAQMPWGSSWARESLLVSFHKETWGGEKYYLLLGRLAQNPEQHKDLIELLYYCNALGFEGRFRIENNGYTQLEILKKRIATILGNVKGGYEDRLSPHWQGVSSTPPAWRLIPPWVVAMLCGLLALGVYLYFLFALGDRSDLTYAQLVSLEIPGTVVPKTAPPSLPPPALNVLRRFLAQVIRERLVDVTEKPGRCIVTLVGDGLFESGSVDVRSPYLPVLRRVAEALQEVNGNVIVSGYTDNVPNRSPRYPSNWELSKARAETVKGLLDSHLGPSGRIRAEGHGEGDPVSDNATREGRARNRRVEIAILLSAQDIHRQLNPSEAAQ